MRTPALRCLPRILLVNSRAEKQCYKAVQDSPSPTKLYSLPLLCILSAVRSFRFSCCFQTSGSRPGQPSQVHPQLGGKLFCEESDFCSHICSDLTGAGRDPERSWALRVFFRLIERRGLGRPQGRDLTEKETGPRTPSLLGHQGRWVLTTPPRYLVAPPPDSSLRPLPPSRESGAAD